MLINRRTVGIDCITARGVRYVSVEAVPITNPMCGQTGGRGGGLGREGCSLGSNMRCDVVS